MTETEEIDEIVAVSIPEWRFKKFFDVWNQWNIRQLNAKDAMCRITKILQKEINGQRKRIELVEASVKLE